MIINKKVCACAVLLATISGRSNAFIITDIPNLIENIASNVTEIYNFAEEMSQTYLSMDLQSAMAGLGIDAANSLAVQQMTQEAQEAQDKSDAEFMERVMPDSDACDTDTLNKMEQENECMAADLASEQLEKAIKRNSNFSTNQADYRDSIAVIASDMIIECKNLQTGAPVDPNNLLSTSLCLSGGIVSGVSVADTMTLNEEAASNSLIDMMAGPIPTYKSSRDVPDNSPRKNDMILEEMRLEAYRSLATSSFSAITSARKPSFTSTGAIGPSYLETLSQFDNDRWGDSEWRAEISNITTDGENPNSVMPSELMRKMAVMDAFQVHLGVLQYKQQMRQEALLAAMLAFQISPPGK